MFGFNILGIIQKYIESRKKVVQILAKVVTIPSGNILTWDAALSNIDVSKYAYFSVRVRSRKTNEDVHDPRKFTLQYGWRYAKDPNFVGNINGETSGNDVLIDTTSAPVYDIWTGWNEVMAPNLDLGLRNNETEAKEYEVDVIGIR